MSAAAHIFPNFTQMMGEKNAGGSTSQITLTNANSGTVDTLKVGLVASTSFNWVAATQAYTTVAQFLANAGSGGGGAQTEVSSSSTGYSRQSLSGVTYTDTGLVSTLNCTSPLTWSATASWSAAYAFFYDYTAGGNSDSTGLLICYWDFGGSVSVVNDGTFTLTINASGLATWTSS